MAELRDELLQNLGYTADGKAPGIDLSKGGQFGYQAEQGAYVNNTGYVPRNIIPILIKAPRGFDLFPEKEKAVWIGALRSLIENQSKTITGLRTGLTLEWSERQFSKAGHMQQDPLDVKEVMSAPVHAWDERYGKVISRFWNSLVRLLIQDPQTNQPGIMNIVEQAPTDHLADFYTFTVLYIEPDPLRNKVLDAWLVTNMAPSTITELESTMDVAGGKEVPEISVEFTGIPYMNDGVTAVAQEILDQINYVNAGPQQRPAFIDKIGADIKAAQSGYVEDIAAAADAVG